MRDLKLSHTWPAPTPRPPRNGKVISRDAHATRPRSIPPVRRASRRPSALPLPQLPRAHTSPERNASNRPCDVDASGLLQKAPETFPPTDTPEDEPTSPVLRPSAALRSCIAPPAIAPPAIAPPSITPLGTSSRAELEAARAPTMRDVLRASLPSLRAVLASIVIGALAAFCASLAQGCLH
jgi:hypothetical protein